MEKLLFSTFFLYKYSDLLNIQTAIWYTWLCHFQGHPHAPGKLWCGAWQLEGTGTSTYEGFGHAGKVHSLYCFIYISLVVGYENLMVHVITSTGIFNFLLFNVLLLMGITLYAYLPHKLWIRSRWCPIAGLLITLFLSLKTYSPWASIWCPENGFFFSCTLAVKLIENNWVPHFYLMFFTLFVSAVMCALVRLEYRRFTTKCGLLK